MCHLFGTSCHLPAILVEHDTQFCNGSFAVMAKPMKTLKLNLVPRVFSLLGKRPWERGCLKLHYLMMHFLTLWFTTQVFDHFRNILQTDLSFWSLRLLVAVGQAIFMQSAPYAQPWNKTPY